MNEPKPPWEGDPGPYDPSIESIALTPFIFKDIDNRVIVELFRALEEDGPGFFHIRDAVDGESLEKMRQQLQLAQTTIPLTRERIYGRDRETGRPSVSRIVESFSLKFSHGDERMTAQVPELLNAAYSVEDLVRGLGFRFPILSRERWGVDDLTASFYTQGEDETQYTKEDHRHFGVVVLLGIEGHAELVTKKGESKINTLIGPGSLVLLRGSDMVVDPEYDDGIPKYMVKRIFTTKHTLVTLRSNLLPDEPNPETYYVNWRQP